MVAFPASPTTGQQFQQWTWDGTKWTPSPQSVPQCGQLQIVGSSPSNQVVLAAINGDLIKVNGIIRKIPPAGLTAAANSCFINGVSGQALAASTFYYVYAFDPGNGTLALDFSTTAYIMSSTPGNLGVAIKTGDDTRSLVGIVYTNTTAPGSGSFRDENAFRYVRSWFNRLRIGAVSAAQSFGPATVGATIIQLTGGPSFITFGDAALIVMQGAGYVDTAGATVNLYLGYDGAAAIATTFTGTVTAAGYYHMVSLPAALAFTPGAPHTLSSWGNCNVNAGIAGSLSFQGVI